MTITHPHHPLCGQQCQVVYVRQGVDPDLILRLADGTHAAIAMSWTDSGRPHELSATESEANLPQLDLQGLRQIIDLFDQLRQEGRLPTPRRRPRRSSATRRKLRGKT